MWRVSCQYDAEGYITIWTTQMSDRGLGHNRHNNMGQHGNCCCGLAHRYLAISFINVMCGWAGWPVTALALKNAGGRLTAELRHLLVHNSSSGWPICMLTFPGYILIASCPNKAWQPSLSLCLALTEPSDAICQMRSDGKTFCNG